MIYVESQTKFTIELNQLFIRTGFFAVKNVGILFQKKVIIPMAALESQKYNPEK